MLSQMKSWRSAVSEQSSEVTYEAIAKIQLHNLFVMRTPTLPFKAGLLATDGGQTTENLDKEGYEALKTEETRQLKNLLQVPLVAEGIRIASHSLATRLYRSEGLSDRNLDKKLRLAAYRYVSRMASRATPFGNFASIGVGHISEVTDVQIRPRSDCYRVARVDMGLIYKAAHQLLEDRDFVVACKLRTNTTIYRVSDSWRYLERHGEGAFQLSSVIAELFLDKCIRSCLTPQPFYVVAKKLAEVDESLSKDEVEEFILQLIREQVLIPEIFPALTTHDPVHDFIDRLAASGSEVAADTRDRISRAQELLASIQNSSPGVALEAYAQVVETLNILPSSPGQKSSPYQIDMHADECNAHLSYELCKKIGEAIAPMMRLCPMPGRRTLTSFAERFIERFGESEIPLALALDPDFGIDFGGANPPQDGFSTKIGFLRKETPAGESLTERDKLLLNKLSQAGRNWNEEIILQEAELKRLPSPRAMLRLNRYCAHFELANQLPSEGGETATQIYLKAILSPLGAQYFGRFCNGDSKLTELVSEMIEAEQTDAPGTIFAEIVHVPSGRMANIATRPPFRAYEIPILTTSGVKEEYQIPIDDILVCVSNGEICLRSKRLNVRIIPRLTNAHNYRSLSNIAIYRFLALLSTDSAESFQFLWGSVFDSFEYLPRVKLDQIVISPAIWNFSRREFADLYGKDKVSEFEKYRLMREFCRKKGLPRFVWMESKSNRMLVDFSSPTSVENFLWTLSGTEHCRLIECFQHDENVMCYEGENRHSAEFMLPLAIENAPPANDGQSAISRPSSLTHGGNGTHSKMAAPEGSPLFPGSTEWAYLKIYGASEALDRFIRGPLAEILKTSLHPLQPDFFFVRYTDPRWHVRVRIRAPKATLWRDIVPQVLSEIGELAKEHAIYDVAIDSYRPENSRYGGEAGMLLCEKLFHSDSIAVIRGLQAIKGLDQSHRWKMAVVSAYQLGFSLMGDEQSTANLFNGLFSGLMRKYRLSATAKRQLSTTFRRLQPEVEALIGAHNVDEVSLQLIDIFRSRDRDDAESVLALRQMSSQGNSHFSIASSLIHMAMNRVFMENANEDETLVYYLIARTLESIQARRGIRTV